MLTVLYSILGFIAGFFILHFLLYFITSYIRKHTKNIRYWFDSKYFRFTFSSSPNIMIHFSHYDKYMKEDGYLAHTIWIEYGGISISINYGTDYMEPDNYEVSKTSYYGFYSIDGELFWHDIWVGNKIYNNPFRPTLFCGCYIYDAKSGKFVNRDDTNRYDESNPDLIPFPYFDILNDVKYINKIGEIQDVNCIKFYIEERSWTLPVLHWLHLDNLYKMYRVDLSFDSDSELGVEAGEWKGGVMGASIAINQEPELYNLYWKVSRGNVALTSQLVTALIKRIDQFLYIDKKY